MGLAKPMNIKIGGGATGTVGAKPAAAVKKSGALTCAATAYALVHICTVVYVVADSYTMRDSVCK